LGRLPASRGASMLEMEKYNNGAASAAATSGGGLNASGPRRSAPTARTAAGEVRICHRDIVNLKQRVADTPPFEAALMAPKSRSEPRGRPLSARSLLASAVSPQEGGGGPPPPPHPPTNKRKRPPPPQKRQAIHLGRQPALALFARSTGHRPIVPANAPLDHVAGRPRESGPNSQRALNRRRRARWQVLFLSVISPPSGACRSPTGA